MTTELTRETAESASLLDRVETSGPAPEMSPNWVEFMARSLRTQGSMVPGEANAEETDGNQAAIDALMADPDYFDAQRNPGHHRELVERVGALYLEAERRAAKVAKAGLGKDETAGGGAIPDTPEGYRLERPALPEGARFDDALEAKARSWFHAAGLDNEAAAKIYARYHAYALDAKPRDVAGLVAAKAKGEAALRSEWGAEYDAKVADARTFLDVAGDEKLIDLLVETGLGNDVELVRLAATLARRTPGELGPQGCEKEIARLLKHKAYWDAAHPDHARIVDRMSALYQAAAPE